MAVARREVLRWMAVSAATSLACRRHDASSPPQAVAEGTLALYEQLLRESGSDDLMAADVRGEIDAAEKKPQD